MLRTLATFFVCLVSTAALAQTAPAKKKVPRKANPGAAQAAQPDASAKAADPGAPAATAAQEPGTAAPQPAPAQPEAPKVAPFDSEEFRRQVMEEVRKELAKAKEEVRKETAWVEQDSKARVQDSEAVEALKARVNLFQPHGYIRMRGEFFNNFRLGRGTDPAGYTLFPGPFVGADPLANSNSQSDANFRFRFQPTFEVSEDLSIHAQLDMLDNILLGSDAVNDPYLSPYTPLAIFEHGRLAETVKVKRLWGRVNTALGELVFGRMGYHWGLGILHNDGNCLDCDYGDTYDRIAFSPRDIKGHHFSLMFDILDKGVGTTGTHGELGRSVDLDTLDDGYRLGIEVTRLDTPEEIKHKLEQDQWVLNYGLVLDFRTQPWDTPLYNANAANPRADVVRRGAKLYQPDAFISLKRKKWRLDAELAFTLGSVQTHQLSEFDANAFPDLAAALQQPVNFFQTGFALQSDVALLPADAILLGVELGGASGDKGANGFGARPWRSGSGNAQPVGPNDTPFRAAGPGDIDGSHIDFSNLDASHGRVNNFVFNRAFNVDMILFRNLITAVTSAWYVKPSIRYRPTGRKTGGGDDTGFELIGSIMYSQAWYQENTPGGEKPLGAELNVGITYDTIDRLHTGLSYGLLLPFGGLRNVATGQSASVAHAVRYIVAIPF